MVAAGTRTRPPATTRTDNDPAHGFGGCGCLLFAVCPLWNVWMRVQCADNVRRTHGDKRGADNATRRTRWPTARGAGWGAPLLTRRRTVIAGGEAAANGWCISEPKRRACAAGGTGRRGGPGCVGHRPPPMLLSPRGPRARDGRPPGTRQADHGHAKSEHTIQTYSTRHERFARALLCTCPKSCTVRGRRASLTRDRWRRSIAA